MVVLGTHNPNKGLELRELLTPHGIELKTLADFPNAIEVVEDGESFAANARLKAVQQAKHLGTWTIGEDSGLCVDALGGAPGIFSARYSGPGATHASNNELLLKNLGDIPWEQRGAHYVCHLTLADPTGQIRAECEGTCAGRIRTSPMGENGFGYDPLFEILELHRTFGQLGPSVKRALSHRGRAIRALVPELLRQIDSPANK